MHMSLEGAKDMAIRKMLGSRSVSDDMLLWDYEL